MVKNVSNSPKPKHIEAPEPKKEAPKKEPKKDDPKSDSKKPGQPTNFFSRPDEPKDKKDDKKADKKEPKDPPKDAPKSEEPPAEQPPAESPPAGGGSGSAGPVSFITPDGSLTINPGDVLTLEMAEQIAAASGGVYVVKDGMLVNTKDPSDVKPIGQPVEEGDIHDLHHNVMGAGGGGNSLNPSGVPDPSKQAAPGEGGEAAASHAGH